MDDVLDSDIQLRIADKWYWWSGYPRERRYYCWRLAETDGPQFYTETAFPSLKPDIDMFGVPRRSRKQRGWHQVAVPSLGQVIDRLGKRTYSRPPAKPSDIPPELFNDILGHLSNRHALARCALVCRYWSVKCQNMIFPYLRLDSRQHALQLLEFMKTPTSAVASFVRGVRVSEVQAVSSTPWLHLVSLIGNRAHQELMYDRVELKGPLTAGQRMRSIHHGVPRSLPAHFSCHIRILWSTDIHFARLDDLMHLVWEMPHLSDLYCERVTWGPLPTALARRKSRNTRDVHRSVNMLQCGPRIVEASVWLAASVQSRDGAFFSLDNLTHVVSLARELENRASTNVKASLHTDHFYVDLGQNRRICFYDSRWNSHPSSQQWHIDTIAFDNRNPYHLKIDTDREPDWTIVNAAIASFPVLERMVVGLNSGEDMVRFKQKVARVHMPHLLGSGGMLKYALWDPAGIDRRGRKGTWLRASPDSDDTEPSGCHEWELHEVYK